MRRRDDDVRERQAKVAKLRAELESTQEVLREAMDFINDDRKLTVEGIRLREGLRREMEEIKKDVEAVRQEHRAD
jgi:DNA topoisomerase VI subunit A